MLKLLFCVDEKRFIWAKSHIGKAVIRVSVYWCFGDLRGHGWWLSSQAVLSFGLVKTDTFFLICPRMSTWTPDVHRHSVEFIPIVSSNIHTNPQTSPLTSKDTVEIK